MLNGVGGGWIKVGVGLVTRAGMGSTGACTGTGTGVGAVMASRTGSGGAFGGGGTGAGTGTGKGGCGSELVTGSEAGAGKGRGGKTTGGGGTRLSEGLGPKRGSTRIFGTCASGSASRFCSAIASTGAEDAGSERVPSGKVTTSTTLKTGGSGSFGVAVIKVAARIR
jgi:hypothetical protein